MRAHRSVAAFVATTLIAGVLVALTMTNAGAVQDNVVPGTVAPSWQTNEVVRALAVANGVVYLGGDFTSVRPPNVAAGVSEVARSRIAAFDANTGNLITSFAPTANGAVYSLAVSPDGSTLYAGGDFTTINGTARSRVAAISTSTGALVTTYAPVANGRVAAIVPTATTVYLGGSFGTVNGNGRNRIAATNAATGATRLEFRADASNVVYALALAKDGSKLYAGGQFDTINASTDGRRAAILNPTTGAVQPFPGAVAIPVADANCTSAVRTIRTDATAVYFGDEGTGGGCFDGTFAANVSDGSLKWKSNCLGATQGIEILNGNLYAGSHAHDCTTDRSFDPDAFTEVGWSRGLSRHLTSRSTETGRITAWSPNTNGGTGGGLGPRVFATDGTQLFVGGEFTTVNNRTQQGFARFSPTASPASPPNRPVAPVAVAKPGGKVAVYVQPPLDLDDTDVVLRLYRSGTTAPIATAPAHSLFWNQPITPFEDDGLPGGATFTYTVDATEANGTGVSTRSPASRPVTVGTVAPYVAAVDADSPSSFWRLNEASGPIVADHSDGMTGGVYQGTIGYGQAGQTAGSTAVLTDGATSIIAGSAPVPTPSTFSLETWIKTTTTSGGKIIGFGDNQGGLDFGGNPKLSGNYDKQLYMTNDGRLKFGVWVGFADILTTPTSYNDGQWHHVVASQGAGGMALFVDGVRIARNGQTNSQSYTGYWRIGGDNLGGWPEQPSSNFFAGTIADTAVYLTALTPAKVVAHWVASGRTAPPSNTPTDTYGQTVFTDEPLAYYRLDDTTGSAAADASGNGTDAAYAGGVTKGQPGALGSQGTAVSFNGTDGNVATTSQTGGPAQYAVEAWFNTNSTSGGKIVGFGNSQSGNSGAYDKHVFLTNDGRVEFGVYNGGFDILSSAPNFNDGQWHHVVASQGPAGMALYLDGQLVGTNGVSSNQGYAGYWRIGGDNLGAWPDRPTSDWFSGAIDEVAIYSGPLTSGQVAAHFVASGRSLPDTVAPATAVTSPSEGDTVNAGATTVTATATDAVGVTSVDLVVDGSVVDTDTAAPFAFSWNATNGAHTLRTVARDAAGNVGTSADVHVTVVTPDTTAPLTAITSPTEGASVTGAVAVTATASDNTAVTSVELRVDGVAVGTSTTSPYTFTWNATGVGSHTLQTFASDAVGNVGSSVPVNVVVPDTTAPTTAITSPSEGDTINAGATTVTATAADAVGVTSVDLLVDGSVVATDSSAPFSFSWTAANGAHTLRTEARDAAGNVGTSADVHVTVVTPDTTAPVTAITSPSNGASVTGSVAVTATASDDTAVTSVELRVDGVPVGTSTTAPYSFTWNAVAPGSHTLQAFASDAVGNVGASTVVTVTVPDSTAPTAAITAPADGASLTEGAVTVSATATDAVGVTSTSLLVDGVVVATDSIAPYSYSWAATVGSHLLQVTAVDSAGNSGASAAVGVTITAASSSLFTDLFSGADGAGWSSAWTTSATSGSATIGANTGVLAFTDVAGAFARAQLTGLAARADSDTTFSYRWSATSGVGYLNLYTRGSGGWANSYRPRNGYGVELSSNSGTVTVRKAVNGAVTTIRSVTGANTVSTAKQWMRLRVVGTTVQFKTWLDGQAEPATWRSTDTDADVTATGQLHLSYVRGGSNVGAKNVAIDDLTVNGNGGVTPPPDTTAPTAPTSLVASNVTQTSADLGWGAASDAVGVTGYRIVRDGAVVATVAGTSYTDTSLTASTTYAYVVRAIDAAGNVSTDSNQISVTTQAASSSLFTDLFSGADGAGWSSAWTTSATSGSATIGANTGLLAFTDVAGAFARAQLTGLAARADSDTTFSYRWSAASGVGYFNVYARGSGGWSNTYRPRNGYGLEFSSNSGTVTVRKVVNGTVTTVRSVTGANTVSTAKQWVRLRVVGSTVQFKTWVDGQAEPATWRSTDTDTDVTATGQLHLSYVRGGSNVGTKNVAIDDVTVNAG